MWFIVRINHTLVEKEIPMSEVEREEQSSQGVMLAVEWHVPDTIQAYIRAYHAVVPMGTIEEEEAEEREWHAIRVPPQQQRDYTNHPDGWDHEHKRPRPLKKAPGKNPSHRSRDQDRENERFQSSHKGPPERLSTVSI
jgi:hypothetical protein